MKRTGLLIISAALIFGANASSRGDDKAIAEKQAQLKQIQGTLDQARDSLQRLIAKQYAFKQKAVDEKESDKEELGRLRDQQEKVENDLSRIKEECLSKEQSLDDERKGVTSKQDEWKYLKDQMKDMFQKDGDGLLEVFPLDHELRQQAIENVKTTLSANSAPAVAFSAFVDYRLKWLARGDSVSIDKATVIPQESGPKELTIVRFGNMLGYGIDGSGTCYYLRQTGRLGNDRFATEKIGAPELSTKIATKVNQWLQAGAISGDVPVEVMQNEQARMLISGKKESYWGGVWHSLQGGGLIMIPLLMLPFWVLYLVLIKWIQFARRSGLMKKQFKNAMKFLDKGDFDKALEYASGCKKGIVATMLRYAIERRSQGRDVGERAVYELLALETPTLNRNLNTLAVIAGAAPLLGLLGTISGMITLFAAVTHYGTGDPKFLAGGISEALITAKTGLAVAIPVLFIHDLLRGAKDKLVSGMEKFAIDLLNAVYPGE